MRLLNAGEDIQPEYALELVGNRLAGPACQTQGYELVNFNFTQNQ
jgi:hypothetical protein